MTESQQTSHRDTEAQEKIKKPSLSGTEELRNAHEQMTVTFSLGEMIDAPKNIFLSFEGELEGK